MVHSLVDGVGDVARIEGRLMVATHALIGSQYAKQMGI